MVLLFMYPQSSLTAFEAAVAVTLLASHPLQLEAGECAKGERVRTGASTLSSLLEENGLFRTSSANCSL